MKIPTKVMDERVKKAEALKLKGYTTREIADELDITTRQVWTALNRESMKESNKKWWNKNKEHIKDLYHNRKIKLLAGRVCEACGADELFKLDFHHIDPTTKLFTIKHAIPRPEQYNEKELQAEVDKCVVLCKSCHGKLHFGKLIGFEYLFTGNVKWKVGQ